MHLLIRVGLEAIWPEVKFESVTKLPQFKEWTFDPPTKEEIWDAVKLVDDINEVAIGEKSKYPNAENCSVCWNKNKCSYPQMHSIKNSLGLTPL